MNKRVVSVALGLLYFTLAVVGGVRPHNHAGGHLLAHKDCAACTLHINGVADVPVATVVVTHAPVEFQPICFGALPLPSYLFPATASRAPPLASA
jgi:hypothetical protein